MAQTLYNFLYPLPPPGRKPSPQREMQVLAVGLPRSGTDSLRTALLMLGHEKIWHGFDLPSERPNDCALWVPLLRAAARGDRSPARKFDWDLLLGDCEGVMDMPPAMFAEELVDFYPNAKIVINRRQDMDAWHKSLNEAADTVMGWPLWTLSWFDAKLRWWYESASLWLQIMGKGKCGFQRNGKQWGMDFYSSLERRLESQGRSYLNWDVKDGWEPLCEYLEKDVPPEDFPWKNKSGEEFEKNANRAVEAMVKRSVVKLGALVLATAVGVGWAFWAT